MITDELIGKRICWTGMGFTLIVKDGNTLYRPMKSSQVCGTVVEVRPHRFYQRTENIAWLKVRLDKPHGAYRFGQAYFDETAGRLFNPGHEPTKFLT